MLPPFIIEEIRKREREEQARRDDSQPRLDLPLPSQREPWPTTTKEEGHERGVIVIDL